MPMIMIKSGDNLGDQFMDEGQRPFIWPQAEEGQRIVVSVNINCGECRQCKMGSSSDYRNPTATPR